MVKQVPNKLHFSRLTIVTLSSRPRPSRWATCLTTHTVFHIHRNSHRPLSSFHRYVSIPCSGAGHVLTTSPPPSFPFLHIPNSARTNTILYSGLKRFSFHSNDAGTVLLHLPPGSGEAFNIGRFLEESSPYAWGATGIGLCIGLSVLGAGWHVLISFYHKYMRD